MPDRDAQKPQSIKQDVANAIVRLMHQRTGRGPDDARVLTDDDTIVVVLGESLSRGEQALIEGGHSEAVMTLRRAYQDLVRPDFIDAVERITGREVTTFMSANHTVPDRAVEIFTLGDRLPDAPGAPSVADGP